MKTKRSSPPANTTCKTYSRLHSIVLASSLATAVAMLATSCSTTPRTIVTEVVGPAPVTTAKQDVGFLQVYSATASTTLDGDQPIQVVHTDYEIDSPDGTFLQRVDNTAEEPARVALRKGSYSVVADSDALGTVSVPVLIQTGKTTQLHLEREKDWNVAGARSTAVVRLPNGQPIGFRAARVERRTRRVASARSPAALTSVKQ